MDMTSRDRGFAGAIPEVYERYMVPLLFEPYAADLAARIAALAPRRVLELAAGTGVLTRALVPRLPADATVEATDLNPEMLAEAQVRGAGPAVRWQPADAQALPFEDAAFDLVACQFGVMFFPDKPRAYAEAARVLRPGGTLLFNVWDRIEANDFAATVQGALATVFPERPPTFMSRVPHGYHDVETILRDLAAGGFEAPTQVEVVALPTVAASAWEPAVALCQGTPMRSEIEARDPAAVPRASEVAAAAVAARFGAGPVTGASRAFVVTVRKAR